MMAVQPTSCSTLRAANHRLPFLPKLSLEVSMAESPVRPPMRPAKNIMVQPIRWPSRLAAKPLAMPRGAK